MKGVPWHVFPTAFSSCPSVPLSQDLSPAKTHSAWLQDLMNLRLLCLIAKIQLETLDRSEVDLFRFREKHPPQAVGHHRGHQPLNVVWLGLAVG